MLGFPANMCSNSSILERLKILAGWEFQPSIDEVSARYLSQINIKVLLFAEHSPNVKMILDDLAVPAVVTMHRDSGLHNILCTPDRNIVKAIDWELELSYEPLGIKFGRIEQYVTRTPKNFDVG